MYVHVYMNMYACTHYACMHVFRNARECTMVSPYARRYVYLYVSVCVYVYVYIYVYVCKCLSKYVCMFVSM